MSSSSSSSSSSPSSLVTSMPDKQSIPTDAELDLIAPKPKLYPNNFIQFPRPGFINDIDSMPSGYWWPWPTLHDAAQDLFPDWIGTRQSLSASQIKIGYTVPINSVTIGLPVGAGIGALLGIVAGGAFSRHFRLSPSKTNLTRFLFAGGFGGLFFGVGTATYCVSRYYSFFRANPNGPVFNPPLSHRQSYQGISKTGELIRTPGLPVGLYQSPFVFIEQQEEKGALNASEAKVYRALLRKMDKEGVDAAKARNAENQKESQ